MSILLQSIDDAVSTFRALAKLEDCVRRAADLVGGCLGGGHKLMVCGNGGSASDGADFSTEFTCRFTSDRRPYPAINLAQDGSLMTAIGNDYGFEEIFARQVWAFGEPGDVLIGISTSGNSRNVLRAFEEAKRKGLASVALLGRDGGRIAGMAEVELIVPSSITARIQDAQKFLLHVICETVESALSPA